MVLGDLVVRCVPPADEAALPFVNGQPLGQSTVDVLPLHY
jgi:hypothetical protein